MRHDIEFSEGEVYTLPFPDGAMRIVAQNQITIADERRLFRRLILAAAAEGQFDPSEQNRETPRFLHKIDRSVQKARLFIDLIAEHRKKNHGNLDVAGP